MSDELIVYGRHDAVPNLDEVRELAALAGWSLAMVQDDESFNPADLAESPLVVGWPSDSRRADRIQRAIETRDTVALSGLADELVAVELAIDRPYSPSADELEEFLGAGLEPDLLERIEKANLRAVCAVRAGAIDQAVEFSWAVASAIGVLTDGVLEDVEEGWVTDCTDDGEA